ncbi:MAG: hypothetical protein ACP5VR_03780 [Acidimicrobiales bacterium]
MSNFKQSGFSQSRSAQHHKHWRSLVGAATVATLATVAATLASQVPAAFALSTSANLAQPGSLASVQARSANLISRRVASLQAAIKVLSSVNFLGTDGTALVNEMQGDINGLEALGTTISAATTVQQAEADQALIFTQFRVYRLVLPVAHDVRLADQVANVDVPAINQGLSSLQALGGTPSGAVIEAYVASGQAQVQVALNAVAGLSAKLLAYTPAELNADNSLLYPAEVSIAAAGRAIAIARRYLALAQRYAQAHPATTTTTSTTTTTTVPPLAPGRRRHLRLCRLRLGLMAPMSVVLAGREAFVLSASCKLRPVQAVRVRVEVTVRGHLELTWSRHFRLGQPMGHNLVELQVTGHEWLPWDGKAYRAASAAMSR